MADSSSDDEDYGPKPVVNNDFSTDKSKKTERSGNHEHTDVNEHEQDRSSEHPANHKRRKVASQYEPIFLENLPKADYYEHSYMHRDEVTHVVVSKLTEFIITGSSDGHVKFWKKMMKSIEFVKHYQAHLGAIHDMAISPDQKLLATTSIDKMVKIFEIIGFDMSNMIECDYVPNSAVWLAGSRNVSDRVAISDLNSPKICVYKSEDASSTPLQVINIHMAPVISMSLNVAAESVVSIDAKGMIEYWDINTFQHPKEFTTFNFKSETDLYDLAKARTTPCCITVSPNGHMFATLSRDKQIRVFDFVTGKLLKKYDESISVYSSGSPQASGLEEAELVRRRGVEKELESNAESLSQCNVVFDASNNFILFASLRGIKVVSLSTNSVVRYIASQEKAERFLRIALYQGIPVVDQQFLLSRVGDKAGGEQKTADELLADANKPDPTIFATSFKRRRFYCISNREPDESEENRDKLNEKPTEDERNQLANQSKKAELPTEAILHTTLGDIVIKLFSSDCPRTVENFTTHIKNGYYDNIIFHRVIKGFMIQTGDPLGDGTGGESIWGGEFEDEFVRTLRHDRPFTVSMANAGPNTNGSQFFITTVPTPWLDNKHTVFGRVTKGFEVVTNIENLKVNKLDRPYDSVKILGAEAH